MAKPNVFERQRLVEEEIASYLWGRRFDADCEQSAADILRIVIGGLAPSDVEELGFHFACEETE